jgi:lambda family phage tail tape measure protein
MSMNIGTLEIDLYANVARLRADMAEAKSVVTEGAKQMGEALEFMKATLEGLGLLEVADHLIEMGHQALETVDALKDLAEASGSTVEALSGLEDVALRHGKSFDTLSMMVLKLNQQLKETTPNAEVQLALKAIGLSVDELRSKDPAEAVHEVAKALGGYADDAAKARLVATLFGKSVGEAGPLLKDLADTERLVGKVSTEQAEQVETFNNQLASMKKNSLDAARSLAGDLLPSINKLLEKGNKEGFLALFGFDKQFFDTKAMADIGKQMRDLASERDTLRAMLDRDPMNADTGRRAARLKQIVDTELPAAIAEYKKARAQLLGITDGAAGGGRGFVNPDTVKPPVTPPKPDLMGDVEIERTKKVIEQEKALYDARNAALKQYQAAGLMDDADYYDASQRIRDAYLEQLKTDFEREKAAIGQAMGLADDKRKAELTKELVDATAAYNAELAKVAGTGAEEYLARLGKQRQQGLQLTEADNRAVAESVQRLTDENKAARDQAEEIGLTQSQLRALTRARMDEAIAHKQEQIAALEAMGATSDELELRKRELELLREREQIFDQANAKQDTFADDPYAGARRGLQQYIDEAKQAGDATAQAVHDALGNLDGELANMLVKGNGFVNDFIREVLRINVIRPMLSQIFQLFSGFVGAGSGAAGSGAGASSASEAIVVHSGGIVGAVGETRGVHPSMFAGAWRYHTGGIAGLAPDEVPAILRKGEEVLTPYDPRNRNNGGGAVQSVSVQMPSINVINNTGTQANARVQRRQDGGFDVTLEAVEDALAARVASGRSSLGRALNSRTGINPVAGSPLRPRFTGA